LQEHELAISGLNEKGRKPEDPVAAFSVCFYFTKLGGNSCPFIGGFLRFDLLEIGRFAQAGALDKILDFCRRG
jgi:hypothetical protein